MLDPTLWADLETHGVHEAHLRMLLRLLQTQRNGWWGWQYAGGHVKQCDARLVFPSREEEVSHISGLLLEDDVSLR
jgi:hypothetical protein